jgi:hypothetical protein
MSQNQRVVLLFGLLLFTAVVMGGCASNRADRSAAGESPIATELMRARASITEAEQAGAAEYGGAQLALAREKVRAAEEAVDDGELERARRLAVEADLDADLAAAITRNRETQALAAEVQSGIRTLEQELERGAPNTPAQSRGE